MKQVPSPPPVNMRYHCTICESYRGIGVAASWIKLYYSVFKSYCCFFFSCQLGQMKSFQPLFVSGKVHIMFNCRPSQVCEEGNCNQKSILGSISCICAKTSMDQLHVAQDLMYNHESVVNYLK